ncbi:MAG: hypothetical protein ACE5MI_05650 [Acidimicrobiia bacterium]
MRGILRWTFRLLFVAAAAIAVSALINMKREWELLTESEIRDRLGQKLDGRIADDQVGVIQDRVVTYLKGPSFVDQAVTTTEEAVSDVAESAAEALGD